MANEVTSITTEQGWVGEHERTIIRIDVAYLAASDDGAIAEVVTADYAGMIVGVTHAVGGVTATNLFDVVAEDANGVDLLCGAGANIAVAADMMRVPHVDGVVYSPFPVVGELTIKMSGNSVNSATGVFSIFIATS